MTKKGWQAAALVGAATLIAASLCVVDARKGKVKTQATHVANCEWVWIGDEWAITDSNGCENCPVPTQPGTFIGQTAQTKCSP